jgi:hypothetical protein
MPADMIVASPDATVIETIDRIEAALIDKRAMRLAHTNASIQPGGTRQVDRVDM